MGIHILDLLKLRAIKGDQVGLMHFYLQNFESLMNPELVEEFHVEILKVVFENMSNVPMVDIANCLQVLSMIGDEKKAVRFVTKL